MKRIEKQEFIKHTQEVAKARKIFGKLADNNITIAWEIYLEVLADEAHKKQLTTEDVKRTPRLFDDFERVKCPECGFDMMIRPVPVNEEGIKTQLVCTNTQINCPVLNDLHSVQWWLKNLEKKKGGLEDLPARPEKDS